MPVGGYEKLRHVDIFIPVELFKFQLCRSEILPRNLPPINFEKCESVSENTLKCLPWVNIPKDIKTQIQVPSTIVIEQDCDFLKIVTTGWH